MDRKFLWQPSGYKAKDYDAKIRLQAHAGLTLPLEVSLRRLIPSIIDQGNLGSCVANAVAYVVRGAIIAKGYAGRLLARLFVYYFARCISGNPTQDEGTYIRAAFDVIRKLGYCPENVWPYNTLAFAKMPPADAVRQAADQASTVGYYRINSTGAQRVRDVMTALAGGYLVAFGTQVGTEFAGWRKGNSPLKPPTANILGGHALTICGYQVGADGKVVFDICNSWGPEWGDEGFCLFHEDYIAWGATDDFWVVESLPDFSE